jgi:hypothetical protein
MTCQALFGWALEMPSTGCLIGAVEGRDFPMHARTAC